MRGCHQAVKLAWATSYPLLVFPDLFDEMVKAARQPVSTGENQGRPALKSSGADLRFEDIHSVSRGSILFQPGGVLAALPKRNSWQPHR